MSNRTDFQRHAWLSGKGDYNSVVITGLTGLSLPILSSTRSVFYGKPYVYSISCCLLQLSPFTCRTYKSVHELCCPPDDYAAMVELPDRRKHVRFSASLYITNLLWTSLELNPGFRAQKPATNLQRHGMTCYADFNYDILLTD